MSKKLLTRVQARAALGDMEDRTFRRWLARGMPAKGRGRSERYPWPEIHVWYVEQVERRARDQTRPKNYDEARAREMAARAELAELELEQRRGKLVTVAESQRWAAELAQRLNAQIQAIPTRHAGPGVGLATIAESHAHLKRVADDLRAELYEAKDVPIAAGDDDGGDEAPTD